MSNEREALLDYALGTIGQREALAVEALLAERPELAAGLRRMQDGLAEMVMQLPGQDPGREVEDRLLAEAATTSPRSHRRGGSRGGPLWVALGLAVTLGLTAWLVFLRLGQRGAPPSALMGQATQPLIDDEGEQVGVLVRLADGRLFLAFEDEPPGDRRYLFWSLEGEEMRRLGGADGRTALVPEPGAGGRLAVTREGVDPPGEPWLEVAP